MEQLALAFQTLPEPAQWSVLNLPRSGQHQARELAPPSGFGLASLNGACDCAVHALLARG